MTMTGLRPYLLAEDLKRERENFNAWLTGLYVHNAVSVALANGFSKNSKAKYIENPIPITRKAQEEQARLKEERMKAQFKAYADSLKGKLPCN